MEPKWIQLKKSKETKWITTLRTAYPCNLNETTDDVKSTNNEIVGLSFPSLKRMYGRMRVTKYILSKNFNGGELFFKLKR